MLCRSAQSCHCLSLFQGRLERGSPVFLFMNCTEPTRLGGRWWCSEGLMLHYCSHRKRNLCSIWRALGKMISFRTETLCIFTTQKPQGWVLLRPVLHSRWFFSENNFGFVAKSNHLMLFMPIWGEEECQKCKDSCYPETSNDELKDLFHKWGGSPRFLFAHIRR